MAETKINICKKRQNIIYDEWLSGLINRDSYRIIVNESFVKEGGKEIIEDLQSKQVFFYSKIPVVSVWAVAFLEKLGMNLIDTNVILQKSVFQGNEFRNNALLEFASHGDQAEVVELARRSFKFSRFHLDTNFPKQLADNIKAEWAGNYFRGKRGNYMVVAKTAEGIKGFMQLLQGGNTLTIDLIAVDQDCRNKGIATDMIAYAQKNCQGISQIKAGTQISNIASIRMYENLGFRVKEAYYVFHYHSSKREQK